MKRRFNPLGFLIYAAMLLMMVFLINGINRAQQENEVSYAQVLDLFAQEDVRCFSLDGEGLLTMELRSRGEEDPLQITIGDGQAGDLRSTVYPVSCDSATAKEFYDNALASGMTESLINTLITGGSGKIRLLVLDYLGRLENILFHL